MHSPVVEILHPGVCFWESCLQESVMGSRAAMQALVPGRVVLVTDRSTGLPELGAVCGAPASVSKGIQLGNTTSAGEHAP